MRQHILEHGWCRAGLAGAVLAGLVLSPARGPAASAAASPAPGTAGLGPAMSIDQDQATIRRDAYGVPHISGRTLDAMWFGAGFAQAQDRMVQLELTRRSVRGTLSELFGPSQLDSDIGARTFFYTDAELEAQLVSLPAPFRQALDGYSRGINAMEAAAYATPASQQKFVPYEFWALGQLLGLPGPYRPEPWSPIDSVAVGNFLARDFGGGGGSELDNLALDQYLNAELTAQGDHHAATDAWAVFNDARWINDPTAPTTVPNGTPPSAAATRGQDAVVPAEPPPVTDLPNAVVRAAAAALAHDRQVIQTTGQTMKVPWEDGSNAFVVAPWKTASHHAALWGAPQEGFGTPSIDGEEYLQGPGYDAGGMDITGAPSILIGENRDIAWTTTSEELVDQQIYVEHADFSTNPPTYLFNGRRLPMTVITESVPVAGQAPQPLTIYRTVHGPVFEADPADGLAFSIRFASWGQETGSFAGFSEMAGDHNLAAYRASVAKVTTLHNFFYSDRAGHIAYFGAGLLPILPSCRTCDPRLPHDGAGSQEWKGFEPFASMPHSVDPQQGYLVNWNTKPDAAHYYQQNGGDEYWGTIYRSDRIAQLVGGHGLLTNSDILAVERDIGTMDGDETYRPVAPYVLPDLSGAYDRLVAGHDPLVDPLLHPLAAPAIDALRRWDQHTSVGSPAMSIWVEFMASLQHNLWGGGVAPGEQYTGAVNLTDSSLGMGGYFGDATYNLTWHVLGGTAGLVPCDRLCFKRSYTKGDSDQLLVESLNDATTLLAGTGPLFANGGAHGFGTDDVSAWGWAPWPDINWDSLDPLAAGVTTNFGTSPSQERSTFMMAVDAGPTLRGVDVLPPGQSGFISASGQPDAHMADQIGLFDNFRYKPMQLP